MRPLVVSALAASLVVVSQVAGAQDQGQNQDAGGAEPKGEAEADADAKGSGTTGGYSYSDKPAAKAGRGKRARAVKRHAGPVVSLPGFEQTAGGGSRLFVALSAPVQVEERKAAGTLTYVLKDANVRVRNNTNALVTVHFNTPVSRARLVPHGKDLHFVVDLRAATTPTWKMGEGPDKSAVLQIDFPAGNFAPAEAVEGSQATAPPKKPPPAKNSAAPKPAPAGPKP